MSKINKRVLGSVPNELRSHFSHVLLGCSYAAKDIKLAEKKDGLGLGSISKKREERFRWCDQRAPLGIPCMKSNKERDAASGWKGTLNGA